MQRNHPNNHASIGEEHSPLDLGRVWVASAEKDFTSTLSCIVSDAWLATAARLYGNGGYAFARPEVKALSDKIEALLAENRITCQDRGLTLYLAYSAVVHGRGEKFAAEISYLVPQTIPSFVMNLVVSEIYHAVTTSKIDLNKNHQFLYLAAIYWGLERDENIAYMHPRHMNSERIDKPILETLDQLTKAYRLSDACRPLVALFSLANIRNCEVTPLEVRCLVGQVSDEQIMLSLRVAGDFLEQRHEHLQPIKKRKGVVTATQSAGPSEASPTAISAAVRLSTIKDILNFAQLDPIAKGDPRMVSLFDSYQKTDFAITRKQLSLLLGNLTKQICHTIAPTLSKDDRPQLVHIIAEPLLKIVLAREAPSDKSLCIFCFNEAEMIRKFGIDIKEETLRSKLQELADSIVGLE